MTRTDLAAGLRKGLCLSELLQFSDGQDCLIFKADRFTTGDHVIYVPDVELNEIPIRVAVNIDNSMSDSTDGMWGRMTAEGQIRVILSYCYTGDDFVDTCECDEALAYRLFCYCDWQHPISALPEVAYEDEEDRRWAKETYAVFQSSVGRC